MLSTALLLREIFDVSFIIRAAAERTEGGARARSPITLISTPSFSARPFSAASSRYFVSARTMRLET